MKKSFLSLQRQQMYEILRESMKYEIQLFIGLEKRFSVEEINSNLEFN